MKTHGYSIRDLISTMSKISEEMKDLELDSNEVILKAYDSFENDVGFGGGSIWVCKDEFLDCEFNDEEYVTYLIETYSSNELEAEMLFDFYYSYLDNQIEFEEDDLTI